MAERLTEGNRGPATETGGDSHSAQGAGHLPKRGGDTTPGPPAGLPRQRRGTTPQMLGRYPDYDVLSEVRHWDPLTRGVVLDRVGNVPAIRFFTEPEARTLRAFCDVVMGQDSEPRIPVLEMVDAKLHAGRLDGFRYHDMPPDPETWRRVAANLDATAREQRYGHGGAGDGDGGGGGGRRGGGRRHSDGCGHASDGDGDSGFADITSELQHEIVQRFSQGELDWDLPASRAWGVVMRGILGAFYSHPWAWNEIGFGGPAYPRGFARLGAGQREHWEVPPEFSIDPVPDVTERGLEE